MELVSPGPENYYPVQLRRRLWSHVDDYDDHNDENNDHNDECGSRQWPQWPQQCWRWRLTVVSSSECSSRSGTADGNCAAGFGKRKIYLLCTGFAKRKIRQTYFGFSQLWFGQQIKYETYISNLVFSHKLIFGHQGFVALCRRAHAVTPSQQTPHIFEILGLYHDSSNDDDVPWWWFDDDGDDGLMMIW